MKNILSTYVYYLVILVIVGIILVSLYFTYIWNNNQSPNQDKYQNFAQLKSDTVKQRDWQRNVKKTNNKDILITAIHGGGIEPGTSE